VDAVSYFSLNRLDHFCTI